jgi:hypothetical protein
MIKLGKASQETKSGKTLPPAEGILPRIFPA